MGMGVDKIVKTCEDRIGRIIVNAAQTCFDVYQKGGEIFPQWKTVQYIMPCYVAMCADTLKCRQSNKSGTEEDEKFSVNYVKLIEGLLKHYEQAYLTWATNITPRKIPNTKSASIRNVLPDTMEVFAELDHFLKMTNLLSICHINPSFSIDYNLHFFEPLVQPMLMWYSQMQPINDAKVEHEFPKIWLLNSLSIAKDLYNTCVQSWQYPNQTNLLAFDGYKELFQTNEVLVYISRTYLRAHLWLLHLRSVFIHSSKPMPSWFKVIENDIMSKGEEKELYEWRFKLMITLSNPEVQLNQTQSIPAIFESGKSVLLKMYNVHKQFAQNVEDVIKKINLPSKAYLPEMSEEHKIVQDLYLKGDFNTLESMLPLLFQSTANTKQNSKSVASMSQSPSCSKNKQTKSLPVNSPTSIDHTSKATKKNVCRFCHKVDKKSGNFVICEACVKEKYPDVNYFCSVVCKEKWWVKEHMAEHLEFELGLADFSHLKL
jgi:hypothetical protein